MTKAPPRIWTWPYTTQTGLSASASGTFRADPWRPLDDRKGPTGQEYIRLDLHEAAVAAARAEGMRTVLERIESAAQILRKAKLNDHAGAIEAAIADARDEFPEAAE